jgi:hypothetical protein
MRPSYVPVMHCEKMAVTEMFRQVAVIEFLVKEGSSGGVIYKRLGGVYGDACMGATSVRKWVKHFKHGNTDIVDQPRCGRPRGMHDGRFFGKGGNDQCNSLCLDAQQTSSCAS